jgi:monofunctional biosynthetic peptidoglycan transglycosylase
LSIPPAVNVSRLRLIARGAWRWTRRLALLFVILVGALLLQMFVYRFAMPAWTPTMAVSRVLGEPVTQQWVPLRRISPQLIRAVIASEDAKFCIHHGIDFGELKAAIEDARSGEAPRGASTITMQVVKNVFLWPGRSYVRKALELPLALVLEVFWPKQRILEVYLNIAEWGPGIYGIEAAARQAFEKRASQLTAGEAARLAVVLPNPVERDPNDLEPRRERVAEIIEARMRRSVNTSCLD